MSRRILVLGSSGMAGHAVTLRLKSNPALEVVDCGPRRRAFPGTLTCDLESPGRIESLLKEVCPDFLINCTGVLVQASRERKREALWVNSLLPRILSEACASRRIKLVHLGTDCVFSGAAGPYREDSFRDGDEFYDRTKALGEVTDGGDLTIRTSIIGPELRADGTGLLHWFLTLPKGAEIKGFRKALWSGVTTLELAGFIEHVVLDRPELSGLAHFSVSGGISKYDLLSMIAGIFGTSVRMTPSDEPVLDKRLICTRKDLGRAPSAYEEQIRVMKDWILSRPDLYPHYRSTP